eukprot:TRINITY_DN64448_c0_g1_i1.p1 TRINITY_DN64448_c0_g1~~TRINITY_DN64448_c0_g1_i1.p1  ORF type:complete len:542 (-),score=63.99 TRINITY_DN64448_c0_g1_i1:75-1700(-)
MTPLTSQSRGKDRNQRRRFCSLAAFIYLRSLAILIFGPSVSARAENDKGNIEVEFHNVGGISAGEAANVSISWTPHPVENRRMFHEILINNYEEWKEVIGAVDATKLRLKRVLNWDFPPSNSQQGKENEDENATLEVDVDAHAKLIKIGSLTIWQHGSSALKDRLEESIEKEDHAFPVNLLFRLDKVVGDVEPGGLLPWMTKVGQNFELESEGRQELLITIRRSGEVVFAVQDGYVANLPTGALIDGRLESKRSWREVKSLVSEICSRPFAGYPDDAAHFCRNKKHNDRFYVTSRYDYNETALWVELERNRKVQLTQINEQSRQLHKFTSTGFSVQKTPAKLISKLQSFYQKERLHSSLPEAGVIVNPTLSSFESDVWHIDLPEDIQKEVDVTLRPLVAGWAGLSSAELNLAAIHGPRLYHNGSSLHYHVDNRESHAFGVIIHIAHLSFQSTPAESNGNSNSRQPQQEQQRQRQTWPLIILDHQGVEHKLPADNSEEMIFYEAATCPHHREGIFIGREFANLFVHYAPQGWPIELESANEL